MLGTNKELSKTSLEQVEALAKISFALGSVCVMGYLAAYLSVPADDDWLRKFFGINFILSSIAFVSSIVMDWHRRTSANAYKYYKRFRVGFGAVLWLFATSMLNTGTVTGLETGLFGTSHLHAQIECLKEQKKELEQVLSEGNKVANEMQKCHDRQLEMYWSLKLSMEKGEIKQAAASKLGEDIRKLCKFQVDDGKLFKDKAAEIRKRNCLKDSP